MNTKPASALDRLFSAPFALSAPKSPFDVAEAPAVVRADAAEGTYEYALVAQAPAPTDVERDAPAIDVRIAWGSQVLHMAHLSPPQAFVVGEELEGVPAGYFVPSEQLGAARHELVRVDGGKVVVAVPSGARAEVRTGGQRRRVEAGSVELAAGDSVEVRAGELELTVSLGKACRKLGGRSKANRGLGFHALSFAVHGSLLAAAALLMPSFDGADDAQISVEQQALMAQYLAAAAEKDVVRKDEAQEPSSEAGSRGEAAPGEAGAAGKPSAKTTGRLAVQGPRDNREVTLSRSQQLQAAADFGIVSLLATMGGDPNGPVSPWGSAASGNDPLSANGSLWANDLGEGPGSGGLSLTGLGEYGGNGNGILGLDKSGIVGTCVGARCGGPGGFSNPRVPGGHKPSGIQMRIGATSASGQLPADAIQRVVRQNFGRFRACYERGLASNPSLAGRVTARFVIDRSGRVSSVANGGSDLPDAGVVGCVVSSFGGLSFPAPENGIVTVSYPISFSPGS
jgi:hypothetical protein